MRHNNERYSFKRTATRFRAQGGSRMTATVYTGGRIFTAGALPWADALVVDGDSVVFAGDAARDCCGGTGCRHRRSGRPPAAPRLHRCAHPPRHDGRGSRPGRAHRRAHAGRDPGAPSRRARGPPDAVRVLGRGWLFDSVPGGIPTAAMIDAAADRPVYLDSNDVHSAWVNTAALRELGITRTLPTRSAAGSSATPAARPPACSTRRR